MELILLDCGLINKAGHSYTLAKTVSEVLARRRLRFRIFRLEGPRYVDYRRDRRHPAFQPLALRWGGYFDGRKAAAITRGGFRRTPGGGSTRSEQRTWKALNETFERDLEALPGDVWRPDNLIGVV